jgi:hypothetical protein
MSLTGRVKRGLVGWVESVHLTLPAIYRPCNMRGNMTHNYVINSRRLASLLDNTMPPLHFSHSDATRFGTQPQYYLMHVLKFGIGFSRINDTNCCKSRRNCWA